MKTLRGILALSAALALAFSVQADASALVQQKGTDVDFLKSKIACFVAKGILKPTQAALLTSTLTAAQNRFDQGAVDNAVALMNNFIACVLKLGQAGQLPQWAVDCLISGAQDVISNWLDSQEG